MPIVGKIESLWRYPVKSMRGEEVTEAFIGFGGVHGDRLYAFRAPSSPPGFPYMTGRENHRMLLHRPRFRDPTRAALPPNLAAARALDPILAAAPTLAADQAIDVETPDGRVLAIDDPALARELGSDLTLLRCDKAITDCRPISLFSLQSAQQLAVEVGRPIDKRRFRANVFLDLDVSPGFAENGFVGKTLRLGASVTVQVMERDPRCAMITLDPDTAERDFNILKTVTSKHDGKAGVYAAVLMEGVVRAGDGVEVVS